MSPVEKFAQRLRAIADAHEEFGATARANQMRSIADFAVRGSEGKTSPEWPELTLAAVRGLGYLSEITRRVLLGDVQCLDQMNRCLHHWDQIVRTLAENAIRHEEALIPLADRLEELGEDASRLASLMPPRPAADLYDDEEIPF